MADNFQQFIQIFISEADENLETLETHLIELENNPEDYEVLNAIFRSAHTIKGSSGLVGLTEVQNFTHHLEDLLDKMRNAQIAVEAELISVILEGVDCIKTMLSNVKNGKETLANVDTSKLIEKIQDFSESSEKETKAKTDDPSNPDKLNNASSRESYYYMEIRFYNEIFSQGIDPLMFFDDLVNHGDIVKVQLEASELPLEGFDPEKFYLYWKLFFVSHESSEKIRDIFLFVEEESTITIQSLQRANAGDFLIAGNSIYDYLDGKAIEEVQNELEEKAKNDVAIHSTQNKQVKQDSTLSGHKEEQTFIRVDTIKLDKLLNMVSELVIAQSQISSITEKLKGKDGEKLQEISAGIDKLSRGLQEQTMQLRMIHIGPTFYQFKRLVRDLSTQNGKKARLIIKGDDTELDKNMISQIGDPLKHMIRNALDHGLETPAERQAKGKSEQGSIEINAFYQEGNVHIEVSDDGRGINKEEIFQKALDSKLISETAQLSDNEIFKLIFHPGLSTATEITDLSGRGVGMDVVLSNIKELNGDVDIQTEVDRGTRFTIKLPLTLAIVDGMLTHVGEQVYIVPIMAIEESIRPSDEQIRTVEGKGEVVKLRDEYISLVRLHEVFGIEDAIEDPREALLVIVRHSGVKVAILVDSLIDQQQIVLKALGKNYKNIRGINSATILGDGKVALVLDINGLVQLAFSRQNGEAQGA